MTLWTSMRNRLHVYVLPTPDLRSALEQRQHALAAFDYCSIQPPEYLHATVQQFAVTSEDVSREEMESFVGRLTALSKETTPFIVPLAEPRADDYSLGVRGTSTPSWEQLTAAVRDAAACTINKNLPLPKAPMAPHLTLGYGVADGSTAIIQAAADELQHPPLPPLAVYGMHFIAVHQDTERGTFIWDTTIPFPFRGEPLPTS